MDASSFFQRIDSMSPGEALSEFSIKYYTVEELLNDERLGSRIRELYEKNYM